MIVGTTLLYIVHIVLIKVIKRSFEHNHRYIGTMLAL